jgi:hypothetical protein
MEANMAYGDAFPRKAEFVATLPMAPVSRAEPVPPERAQKKKSSGGSA